MRAIAVTPDGETAITGSFDSSAILWSVRRAEARQVLRFHDGQVNAVAALPDGQFATAGSDARVAIWSEGDDDPAKSLEGHSGPVVALAVSPDGSTLASASWDGTVRLWPLRGGGVPRALEGHNGNVNAVTFLRDGHIASAGYDSTLRIWPPVDGGVPQVVTMPAPLNGIVELASGELAVAGADGRVRVLSRQGSVRAEAEVAPTPLIALAASPDGSRLAVAGLKGAVVLLEGATLRPLHNLVGPGLPVWSLAFAPDGLTLFTGGSDRVVRRWSVETGEHMGAIASAPPDPLAVFAGERGAELFRACVACHTLRPDEGDRAGPTLHGLFGRKIASVPGYPYSAAFRSMDIIWTPETVSRLFELGPATYTPGTKMPEQRIGRAEDRAALMRFLEKATGSD